MKSVVIVDAVRSPIGRALKGSLIHTRIDDLAVHTVRALLKRNPTLDLAAIEDVAAGCAFPEGEQGLNIARSVSLMCDIPVEAAAVTVNRFCGSSMQTTHQLAHAMAAGNGEVALSIGLESMSHVPMGGYDNGEKALNPELLDRQALWPMPQTAQNVAEEFNVSREDMDQYAVRSHQKAAAATAAGKFKDEIIPVEVTVSDENFQPTKAKRMMETDDCIRADSTVEKLRTLKPIPGVFSLAGGEVQITAGNSCPTNDGVAALLLMTEDYAKAHGFKPLARIKSAAVAGVHPRIMGVGPWPASEKALKRAGLTIKDIGTAELNEAFAVQVLASARKLELNLDRVNPNGGAIALGHPLGCSGARLLVTLTHEMRRSGTKYGLATMCIGGGMGIATVLENAS